MEPRNLVLFGICGIGLGHSLRQSAIIDRFLENGINLAVFGSGQSYRYFKSNYENIACFNAEVPWIHSEASGLNFERSYMEDKNRGQDFYRNSFKAMNGLIAYYGKSPDLVISDYEPYSAQLAYAKGKPLITIDQQSKYLGSEQENVEEHERLSMFFPVANGRVATSFFNLTSSPKGRLNDKVTIVPPILRKEVCETFKSDIPKPESLNLVVVYLSSYLEFPQGPNDVLNALQVLANRKIRIFCLDPKRYSDIGLPENTEVFEIGSKNFWDSVTEARFVICTAGHTLLSELMFAKKPTYTVALPNSEQNINASIIEKGGFGQKRTGLSKDTLVEMDKNVNEYYENICNDTNVLLKGNGINDVFKVIRTVVPNLVNFEQ